MQLVSRRDCVKLVTLPLYRIVRLDLLLWEAFAALCVRHYQGLSKSELYLKEWFDVLLTLNVIIAYISTPA